MNDRRDTAIAIAVAISSVLIRLVTLQWLHPLNWDELEFYRATRWIAEGRVPFRDFWEHHTPLAWIFYAPFSLLTDSPGVDAIIALRWAQVPVWMATFWLASLWMGNAGLPRFARWASMAIAFSSTWLMNPAVEFRLDPLSCLFYMAALVSWQRDTSRAMFGAGALFCLTVLTNMRMIPLVVVTALVLRVVDAREKVWRGNPRANWIFAGGIVTLAVSLLYFVFTDSLGPMLYSVIFENRIGDRYAQMVLGAFPHRLLILFGVRVLGSDRLFEIAAIDAGGIAVLLLGVAGLYVSLRKFRQPDQFFVMAFLQVTSLVVIAAMNFVYVYHFEIVIVMMLPFIALVIQRIPRRGWIFAVFALAWSVNFFASVFRGKEADRAYQDFVMRELHARTRPGEKFFAGMPWALRREPAYHYWFLPDMTLHLVMRRHSPPYFLRDVVRDPPAIVVVDHSAFVWMTRMQRDLAAFCIRHYIPLWSNLWVPGMNVRLRAERPRYQWLVPRDGTYRLFANEQLAKHLWFRDPFYVAAQFSNPSAVRQVMPLPPPAPHAELRWWVESRPVTFGSAMTLRKGQRLAVEYSGQRDIGVILLPGNDTILFRHPSDGATLEASTSRNTHVPRIGIRVDR